MLPGGFEFGERLAHELGALLADDEVGVCSAGFADDGEGFTFEGGLQGGDIVGGDFDEDAAR